MDIKRGSVTPVDLTGQADGDYIRNDAGVWKPRNPFLSLVGDSLRYRVVNVLAGSWTTGNTYTVTLTGTAGVTTIAGNQDIVFTTGATANSTVLATTGLDAGLMPGSVRQTKPFNKYLMLDFTVRNIDDNTTGVFGCWYGVNWDDAAGVLGSKGIGWGIKQRTLYAQYHNGATLTDESLGAISTNATNVKVVFTPGASLAYYVNNTLTATYTTDLPATTVSVGHIIRFYTTNGATAAEYRTRVPHGVVVVGY